MTIGLLVPMILPRLLLGAHVMLQMAHTKLELDILEAQIYVTDTSPHNDLWHRKNGHIS